jgi:hypothetical protein
MLEFSTFFGLYGGGHAVVAAPDGSAFWSGVTRDAAMFVSPGAVQPTLAGNTDAFIARFSAAGSPVTSTYLGGSGDESHVALALGHDGAIYAGGTTNSTDLHTTPGAFQITAGLRSCATYRFFWPCTDGFVAKLSNDETQLQYLTYLREADTTPPQSDVFDSIKGIAVDMAGNAYVTGSTTSASYPSTPDAYDTTCGSPSRRCSWMTSFVPTLDGDVFVTKLNAAGSGLLYSTFLGGSSPGDRAVQGAHSIVVDAAGRAYVAGYTTADDFPTVDALETSLQVSRGGFVSRFSADGHSLEFSTYFRGIPEAVALGPNGTVSLAGRTTSADFPTTPDAYQPSYGGGNADAFVAAISVSSPLLHVEAPAAGQIAAPLQVLGWAIDRGSATGPGIDAVHVYVFPNPGSGVPPIFLGVAATGFPSSDAAALYGPQFSSAGYALTAESLAGGTYLLAVYGRSTLTGTFSVVATRTVVIDSRPMLVIDAPADGATIRAPLSISGWALDLGAASGTGINDIHVWAYPNPGSGAPPVFVGAAHYGLSRADVGAAFGSQFSWSGYQLSTRTLALGTYLLAVFARSTVTNSFVTVQTRIVTVEANPVMAVDQPTGGSVGQAFTVSGWAVDYAAETGVGVDAVHVWAYPNPGSGSPPVFLGAAAHGTPRPDVGHALGDPRFANSGFRLQVDGLSGGTYDLVVYARSTVTLTFNQYRVIRVTIP